MAVRQRVAGIAIATLLACAVVVMCGWLRYGNEMWAMARLLWVSRPTAAHRGEWERIVRSYREGKLAAQGGVIILPPELKDLTRDGRVYVTTAERTGEMFLFTTWRGKGSNFEGFLFYEGPEDLKVGPVWILGPGIRSNGSSGDKIEATVDQRLGGGWYKAYSDLD
jgi:hypothetical protein